MIGQGFGSKKKIVGGEELTEGWRVDLGANGEQLGPMRGSGMTGGVGGVIQMSWGAPSLIYTVARQPMVSRADIEQTCPLAMPLCSPAL